MFFKLGKIYSLFFDTQESSIPLLDALQSEILNDVLGVEQSPEIRVL